MWIFQIFRIFQIGGYIGTSIIFAYHEWLLIRQNFINFLNPLIHLQVLFNLITEPVFWFFISITVISAIANYLSDKEELVKKRFYIFIMMFVLLTVVVLVGMNNFLFQNKNELSTSERNVSLSLYRTIELPIANLSELNKDEIIGKAFNYQGGVKEYIKNYKENIALVLQDSESTPYNGLVILPYTQDLLYIEGLIVTGQLSNLVDKELIDSTFRLINPYPKYIQFQVSIYNGNKTIDIEKLNFIYEDNLGTRNLCSIYSIEEIPSYEENAFSFWLNAELPPKPEKISWFRLRILSEGQAQKIGGEWTFMKK